MFNPGAAPSPSKPKGLSQGQILYFEEDVFTPVDGQPKYAGVRKNLVKVLDENTPGYVRVEVVASEGANFFAPGTKISRPMVNLKKGVVATSAPASFKAGGYLVGQSGGKQVVLDSADRGGLSVGSTHADGGIKGTVGAAGKSIEFEDKEIVESAAVATSQRQYDFEGHTLTPRQILSKINQDHGGVAFADGGDLGTLSNPIAFKGQEIILTAPVTDSRKTYSFQGQSYTPRQIASMINQDHGGVAF